MIKTLRRALVKLARDKVVASTSEYYSDLVRMRYAVSLGLIATPGAKRCTSLRAGYRITDRGAERAKLYDDDGMLREVPPAPSAPSQGGLGAKRGRRGRSEATAKRR